MFRLSFRQRRRWTHPLVALLLLHWCFGFGDAMASVICLESSGKIAMELVGEPCPDVQAKKAQAPHCIDLPAEASQSGHEPNPETQLKLADLGIISLMAAVSYLLPLSRDAPPNQTDFSTPIKSFSVLLRETAVLLI